MYKNILLCTDGSPAADVAVDGAIWMAGKLGAGIHGLYVTDIRMLEGPWFADLGGAAGAQPYAALVPQLQEIQREKADMLLGNIQKKCRQQDVPCEVFHETGLLTTTVLDYERRADLVVLGQRGEHAQWTGNMLGSGVERVVRASIKPTLVMPASFRPISRILLAYDGSDGADKALEAGLDLAGKLGAEVTLLTACYRDNEDSAAQALRKAKEEAELQGVKPHAQLAHGDAEVEILKWVDQTKADLIVMGAYGHSRLREFFLGSITHQVMRKATVPLLLARG
jgi:nucleotide-binding universal stress UspA family protein